jgi:futalosine hydrolase
MKILIVSATESEVKLLYHLKDINIDFLVTGIGIPLSVLKLSKHLNQYTYDLIINVGIAGSFNKQLKVGDVVQVFTDRFADIGFEDKDNFIPIHQTSFSSNDYTISENTNRYQSEINLSMANGITVNSTSGNEQTIKNRINIFSPDTESMEGAAIALISKEYNTNFIQIRSISNPVAIRNKADWNIPLAIKNLSTEVNRIIKSIQKN